MLLKQKRQNIKGGTLNVALTAPPSGVYSSLLNSTHADAVVEGYFNENLLTIDKKYVLNHILLHGRTSSRLRK